MDLTRVYPPDRLQVDSHALWEVAMLAPPPANRYGGMYPLQRVVAGGVRVRLWAVPEPLQGGWTVPPWEVGPQWVHEPPTGMFPSLEELFVGMPGWNGDRDAAAYWADGVVRLMLLLPPASEKYRWCWYDEEEELWQLPERASDQTPVYAGEASAVDLFLVRTLWRTQHLARLDRRRILDDVAEGWPAEAVPARAIAECTTLEEVRRLYEVRRRGRRMMDGGFGRPVQVGG